MSSASQEPSAPSKTPLPRRRRWGLRTLGCLTLAIFSIVIAGMQGHHTVGTLGCTLLGIGGGVYCSVRGVRDLLDLEWYRQRMIRRKPAPEPIPDDDWRVGGSQP